MSLLTILAGGLMLVNCDTVILKRGLTMNLQQPNRGTLLRALPSMDFPATSPKAMLPLS